MAPPNIVELNRPFDPLSTDAEERYDSVVRRLNRTRIRRAEIAGELAELERRFLENDLVVRSGPRRGQPLAPHERRECLDRMLDLGAIMRRLNDEESFAASSLARMNEALDRWARETYGPA